MTILESAIHSRSFPLERLLDFAEQIRDEGEVERIRRELMALVEECGDGSCVKCGG